MRYLTWVWHSQTSLKKQGLQCWWRLSSDSNAPSQHETRGHSVDRIPPPCSPRQNPVSIQASSRLNVRVSEVGWCWSLYQYSRRHAQRPRSIRIPAVSVWRHLRPCLRKKTVQISFCQNFVKFLPILVIFGRKMAKRLQLCKVHSISISSNSRHHTTVLNADVPNCYTTLKVVIFNKLSSDLISTQ